MAHLDVNTDMGNFVYVVSQMPMGHHYMAAGSICSRSDFMTLWAGLTGHRAAYKQVSLADMMASALDKDFGREVEDMFSYPQTPVYDGGKKSLGAKELQEVH